MLKANHIYSFVINDKYAYSAMPKTRMTIEQMKNEIEEMEDIEVFSIRHFNGNMAEWNKLEHVFK